MEVEEIADNDELYRRIHPLQVKDGRPTSAAFKDPEMSVDVARVTTPQRVLSEYSSHGLASITAGYARSLEQDVFHDPVENNPAHAIVKGNKPPRIAKSLARSAKWDVLPPSS
ncbi:MAG: hypothetical protein K8F29_02645 [Kofleriaceae bacterium]|nr:hypothetical protein [Candidatus Methylomirabilis lanthanidiphila]